METKALSEQITVYYEEDRFAPVILTDREGAEWLLTNEEAKTLAEWLNYLFEERDD